MCLGIHNNGVCVLGKHNYGVCVLCKHNYGVCVLAIIERSVTHGAMSSYKTLGKSQLIFSYVSD